MARLTIAGDARLERNVAVILQGERQVAAAVVIAMKGAVAGSIGIRRLGLVRGDPRAVFPLDIVLFLF
jgi:hypothetical protein